MNNGSAAGARHPSGSRPEANSPQSNIGKTKTEGQDVQQTMDKVIAELNTIVATLTPAKAKK